MPRPASVLVISDHDVVHSGLTALLSDRPELTLRRGGMDVLILDGADVVLYDVMGLVDNDGSELDLIIKETDTAVLAVTRDMRPDLADIAIVKGVDGCVSMDANRAELVAAVETAAWGDLSGAGSPDDVDFRVNPAHGGDRIHLAPREVEVLGLIVDGLSNIEIAERLYLSINSVKTYIRGAYRRIDVQTRSQAVVWAMQHGIGSPPSRSSGR